MVYGIIPLRSMLMAVSAGLVFTACNGNGGKSGSNRDEAGETSSQGTGYGDQGKGIGGSGTGVPGTGDLSDRTTAVSDTDTDFVRSFYGPPGSDWRFTPGTSLYDFQDMGIGGTGPDSQAKTEPAEVPNASKQDKVKTDGLRDSAKKDTGAGDY